MINIPPEFWETLSSDERDELFDKSIINNTLCLRLWGMLGRKDPVPKELGILINKNDVEEWIKNANT